MGCVRACCVRVLCSRVVFVVKAKDAGVMAQDGTLVAQD